MNQLSYWRASAYRFAFVALVALAVFAAACAEQTQTQEPPSKPELRGTITADGSSTVFPITEAMAEAFGRENREVRVTVGVSGTGGGFKKFCNGETDISNASRPIKQAEVEACQSKGIEFIELPIAYDGLSVVVNKANDWVDQLTVAELKTIWEPAAQGTIMKWSQVRPGWPDRPLTLYGAGTDSGTFDYFTEAIVGKEDQSRGDYTASEDDNVLVMGVAGDPNALGYFGYSYAYENLDKLKLVPIVDPKTSKAVEPSEMTIRSGEYAPLSRPIFIYISATAANRPEVRAFVEFYLSNPKIVAGTGYVSLSDELYAKLRERLASNTKGSVFTGGQSPAGKLESLYK